MSAVVDEQYMSPEVSPNDTSAGLGVRRVNNLPVFIIGGAVLVFLIVMVLVAADRADQQNRPEEQQIQKSGNASMVAKEIAGSNLNGMIPEATKPLVIPEQGTTTPLQIVRTEDINTPPTPPSALQGGGQTTEDDFESRLLQMKRQQFEDAVKAKTTVSVEAPRSAGSSSVITGEGQTTSSRNAILAKFAAAQKEADTDPLSAYQKRMAALKEAGIIGGGSSGGGTYNDSAPRLLPTGAPAKKIDNDINQFADNGTDDRWRLDSKPEAPRTPYELRAGFVIPGTLISGINSELPGQIMAQVAQDIFDTPTGKYLLIPQGSRLVGAYSAEVAYGQSRVLVAWQRIVFPDGKAMDIGAMPGADSAGYAGFTDQVNNHYLRIFGSALLMSAITAGITYSQDQNQQTGVYQSPSASSALSSALGQQLGQTTSQMIMKNLNIAPTLEIRPGYRFNVVVTKDLTLTKPYQAFDY